MTKSMNNVQKGVLIALGAMFAATAAIAADTLGRAMRFGADSRRPGKEAGSFGAITLGPAIPTDARKRQSSIRHDSRRRR